jgi:integrase
MPRRKKGARLWLRPARKDRRGRVTGQSVWIIVDGTQHIATRCTASENTEAEQALSAYLASKYQPLRKRRSIEEIDVADVLSIYLDATLPALRAREGVTEDDDDSSPAVRRIKGRIGRLNEFWGGKTLADINGDTCREYGYQRTPGGARRDLQDLSAAIGHHLQEGYHREIVKVTLPEKGPGRERWLTRNEAAALLWTCWRYREAQRRHRGQQEGQILPTAKRPLQHLARFILIGLYTGTRAAAIAAASPVRQFGRSFVDLDAGIYYRLAQGQQQTNKRQPPVPLPTRLLAHLRRWYDRGIATEYFVEWNHKPVSSVKTAMASAVRLTGLPTEHGNITPHTLRHTAATWLMQNGAPVWEAAGFLGMSEKTLRETYGHHHPDFMRGAADAISRNRRQPGKIGKSLADRGRGRFSTEKVNKNGGPGRTRTSNQTVMSGRL